MGTKPRRSPDDVREAIKGGVTKAELARRAGVHKNTLANVESPDWAPRWPTLEKLCEAVDEMAAPTASPERKPATPPETKNG